MSCLLLALQDAEEGRGTREVDVHAEPACSSHTMSPTCAPQKALMISHVPYASTVRCAEEVSLIHGSSNMCQVMAALSRTFKNYVVFDSLVIILACREFLVFARPAINQHCKMV